MPTEDLNQFNLSDYLSGPAASILIPALAGVAGMTRPIPTRFGTRRAGLSGLMEGGLTGLNLVSQMQGQRRALDKEKRLSELFTDLSTKEIPTGRQISKEVPTGEFGPTRETEPGDFPVGNVPQTKTEMAPEMRPLMDKRLSGIIGPIGKVAPELGAKALLDLATKQREEFTLGPDQTRFGPGGEKIATGLAARVPFAEQENRLKRAGEIAVMELPVEKKRAMIGALGLDPVKFLGAEEKLPPSMTDNDALAIEAAVNKGLPLNRRQLTQLGIADPEQARTVVQEMARIKKTQQVDAKTAFAQALAGFKQTQMTGRESQIFRFNNETGQIEDAVSAGMPETEALKKGFRKLGAEDIKTIKRGEATLESLDDFEVSARKVLSKEPGIVNMTWQQLETWFKQKQSDPDVVLFQTQMTRSLPLMIQSLGLSGARAGVALLNIEKAALPNSAMTLDAALKLLDRDRKTIRAIQKSSVSGKFGGQPSGERSEGETAEEVKKRLLGR